MKTNYLTVSDLTAEQMLELKQAYLCQHFEECEDREPSWGELANADSICQNGGSGLCGCTGHIVEWKAHNFWLAVRKEVIPCQLLCCFSC